jgi:SAM-dependent methyltransferase
MRGERDGAYVGLTEAPGGLLSLEGAHMLYARYAYGAEVAVAGRTLEVGCGPGIGLGRLDLSSSTLVGADFDSVLLRRAQETYRDRIPLVQLDVQWLPFQCGVFDTVLFYEGSYYIPNMERAFDELARVLSPEGTMVFVNANPERADFIPSPRSVHYHSATEFREALTLRGFEVRVEGAYPVRDGSARGTLVMLARIVARTLGFIPGTLAGRAILKRALVGKLVDVPAELQPDDGISPSRCILDGDESAAGFKVLYVTARRSPS